MDVETLLQLQSQANQINTLETLPPAPPMPSPAPEVQMVTKATQTHTWNELTLQMISDIISHQVIHMTKEPGVSETASTTCKHYIGMTLKDMADLIWSNHDMLCTETGIKLAHNILQVTVDFPPSFIDYVKTTVEIHFPAQINPDTVSVVKKQTMATGLDGNTGNNDALNTCSRRELENLIVKPTQSRLASKEIQNNSEALQQDNMIPKITDSANTDVEAPDLCPVKTQRFAVQVGTEVQETIQKEDVQNVTNDDDQSELIIKKSSIIISSVDEPETPSLRSSHCASSTCDDDPSEFTIKEPSGIATTVDKSEMQSLKSKSHKCKDCGQLCTTLRQLKYHMQTHSSNHGNAIRKQLGFDCSVCKKTFESRWKLRKHEPIHAPGRNIHPCQHCDKICKTRSSLQRHKLVHELPPSYTCNDCGLSFRLQVKLKQHMTKVHNVIVKHKCDICGAVYKNKNTLKDHLVEHSGKEFLCDMCGKKFSRPELLRCHRFRHRVKKKPKSFNCSMCPKSYATDAQLQVHIRLTHIKERANVCKICDKKFFYRYQLVAHEKAHNGVMEHTCKYCNKGFLKKASLVTHEMIHTGNKPYKCRHCDKGFATKGHQQRHERLHTDSSKPERTFECNVCKAKFRHKGQCKDHEKRHVGVKDHDCKYCSKSFVTGSDLLRHLRTHTEGKPHQCQHCNQTFAKRTELLTHEVSHVGIESVETVA